VTVALRPTQISSIYAHSLHDALPISEGGTAQLHGQWGWDDHRQQYRPDVGEAQHGWLGPRCEQYLYLGERLRPACRDAQRHELRSAEHPSELQSLAALVRRLLLENKQ